MPEPRPDDTAAAEAGPARTRRRRKRRSWGRRKHLGLITIGVALVVLVVGVLLVVLTWDDGRRPFIQQVAAAASSAGSRSAGATPSSAAPTATAPKPASSAPTASGPTTVRGAITAVGDRQWTVRGSTGLSYTILITDATTLPRTRDFASFVVGDAVSVKGTLDQGTITAASVVPGKGD